MARIGSLRAPTVPSGQRIFSRRHYWNLQQNSSGGIPTRSLPDGRRCTELNVNKFLYFQV